jgi:hypothetical protein
VDTQFTVEECLVQISKIREYVQKLKDDVEKTEIMLEITKDMLSEREYHKLAMQMNDFKGQQILYWEMLNLWENNLKEAKMRELNG